MSESQPLEATRVSLQERLAYLTVFCELYFPKAAALCHVGRTLYPGTRDLLLLMCADMQRMLQGEPSTYLCTIYNEPQPDIFSWRYAKGSSEEDLRVISGEVAAVFPLDLEMKKPA